MKFKKFLSVLTTIVIGSCYSFYSYVGNSINIEEIVGPYDENVYAFVCPFTITRHGLYFSKIGSKDVKETDRFIFPRLTNKKGINEVLITPGLVLNKKHHRKLHDKFDDKSNDKLDEKLDARLDEGLDWKFYYMLWDTKAEKSVVWWTDDYTQIKAPDAGIFEAYFFILDNSTGRIVYPDKY